MHAKAGPKTTRKDDEDYDGGANGRMTMRSIAYQGGEGQDRWMHGWPDEYLPPINILTDGKDANESQANATEQRPHIAQCTPSGAAHYTDLP